MMNNIGPAQQWQKTSPWPTLVTDEAHVWLAHLPALRDDSARLAAALSCDEEERATKIPVLERRERRQQTRAVLRLILARCLDCDAAEIVFRAGAHGKPELQHPAPGGLHFNTSHSGDYAVFAVTRAGAIGVDIERVNEQRPRLDEIVARYFATGEQDAWRALPETERVRGFFDLWTRKEAFVKARGDGVFSGLDQFEVSLVAPRLLSVGGDARAAAEWWMASLPPLPGYTGAVVVHAPAGAARFWKWE